jgi:hypothetical protein
MFRQQPDFGESLLYLLLTGYSVSDAMGKKRLFHYPFHCETRIQGTERVLKYNLYPLAEFPTLPWMHRKHVFSLEPYFTGCGSQKI